MLPLPSAPLKSQQPSPQQFLLGTPRGAYTTLRVQRDVPPGAGGVHPEQTSLELQLVDWGTHLERLIRSLRALHVALGGYYSRYYAWLEGTGAPESASLQHLLGPPIRAALEAAEQADAAVQHLMLVVVLPPAADEPCGLHVRAAAYPCAPPGSKPCTAIVLGAPRSVPEGKDSGWVAERQPLELLWASTGGASAAAQAEVLLSSSDGRLLEGLVTNLFVVTRGGDDGGSPASQPASAGAAAGSREVGARSSGSGSAAASLGHAPVVVWTAGVQDSVVWGTMRARVLQVCHRLGYTVREEAPSQSDRHTWAEAFLTNSLRLVQPLRSIECSPANVWGHPAWQVELPAAPGPITAELAASLMDCLPTTPASAL